MTCQRQLLDRCSAVDANRIVYAQAAAARRARPRIPNLLKPRVRADVPDPHQAFNHTMAVSLCIPAVKRFQLLAGEGVAFVAKTYRALAEPRAVLPDKRAVLVSYPASFTAFLPVFLPGQVVPAKAAVHTAWCGKRILNRKIIVLFLSHRPTISQVYECLYIISMC